MAEGRVGPTSNLYDGGTYDGGRVLWNPPSSKDPLETYAVDSPMTETHEQIDANDPTGPHAGEPLVPGRRRFVAGLTAGAVITALGGATYVVTGCTSESAKSKDQPTSRRVDGKPRLPPGQEIIQRLRPMGKAEGGSEWVNASSWRLRVHGAVKKPLDLSFKDFLALPQVERTCDVHCVTKWSVFDARFTGVQLALLADMAGIESHAAHVIFESDAGYTANIRLDEALTPDVLIAHEHDGLPLAAANGAPLRSVVPALYFWKSTKFLTGIRFQSKDEPGYWETRGYHNHADPWKEERYS